MFICWPDAAAITWVRRKKRKLKLEAGTGRLHCGSSGCFLNDANVNLI